LYFLLGIDDTDTPDASDTAALALSLGENLESRSVAKLVNISCHQLIQNPSVPATRQNVACCLHLDVENGKSREIDLVCRETLLRESYPGSNAGYALAAWSQFDHELVVWGKTAKMTVLSRQDALGLARRCGIFTAGILGSGTGVIGALAAIGLRFEGNDGWINWMPGLNSLYGTFTQVQLAEYIHFDRIENQHHSRPAFDDRILFDHPVKPVLKDGKVVLPVSAVKGEKNHQWIAG